MKSERATKPQKLKYDFSKRTYVMGILNVTPDSFSDGGRFLDSKMAVARALEMADEGADIIDIGGESTRPGSKDISRDEELDRILPVIEAVSKKIDTTISVDTRKSEVAEAALKAGAGIVNDISGLRCDEDMARVVARHNAGLIVMHMKGTPQDMQDKPAYKNLIHEIICSLKESLRLAKDAGVAEENIIIDPGIGFGKTVKHNLQILNRLNEFKILGRPVCIGTSRKSFIGKILDHPEIGMRLFGTLATCVIAIMNGANILRVHDIKETLDIARMTDSVLRT